MSSLWSNEDVEKDLVSSPSVIVLMIDLLKCTVFNAATSHPSDCNTKVAIVLPTYLMTMSNAVARSRESSQLITHP